VKKDLKTQLTDEMIELSRKQSDALQTATYLSMSKAQGKAFDERCKRIGKIMQLLNHRADE
jgi:hypothetical protein